MQPKKVQIIRGKDFQLTMMMPPDKDTHKNFDEVLTELETIFINEKGTTLKEFKEVAPTLGNYFSLQERK